MIATRCRPLRAAVYRWGREAGYPALPIAWLVDYPEGGRRLGPYLTVAATRSNWRRFVLWGTERDIEAAAWGLGLL